METWALLYLFLHSSFFFLPTDDMGDLLLVDRDFVLFWSFTLHASVKYKGSKLEEEERRRQNEHAALSSSPFGLGEFRLDLCL